MQPLDAVLDGMLIAQATSQYAVVPLKRNFLRSLPKECHGYFGSTGSFPPVTSIDRKVPLDVSGNRPAGRYGILIAAWARRHEADAEKRSLR